MKYRLTNNPPEIEEPILELELKLGYNKAPELWGVYKGRRYCILVMNTTGVVSIAGKANLNELGLTLHQPS